MAKNKDSKKSTYDEMKEEFTKAWDGETAETIMEELEKSAEEVDADIEEPEEEEAGTTVELKSPEVDAYGKKVIYGIVQTPNGGSLNCRTNPDKKASVLLSIPSGTTVIVREFSDEWIIVKYHGYEGFCMKKFIKVI